MGKPIYRMSQVGICPRALSAMRQGYKVEPAPAWLETAAEEGKWHEERLVIELQKHWQVSNFQQEVILEYPSFRLVGHIDGKIQDYDLQRPAQLLEIKSMSQFEFDRWMKEGFKSFPKYADQLACYMEATGLTETLYIVKNRSSGYTDKRVIKTPSDINAVVDKLMAIEDWLARNIEPGARDGLYPADFDPNSLECRRCEYKGFCVPEPKELTPIEEAGLKAATELWRQGKAQVEVGQELVNKAKEVFEEHTRATGIDRWKFNDLAISLIHVKETLAYPKGKLLQIFTEEQLKPVGEIKLPYDYIKITDLTREE